MNDFMTTWWKVPVPAGWQTERTRDFLRLTRSGTSPSEARIYFSHKPYALASDADIEGFAQSHRGSTVQRTAVTFGILSGIRLSGADDPTQRRLKWCLIHKHMVVEAFLEGKTDDIADIEDVLQHLQLTEEGKTCANNTSEDIVAKRAESSR